MAFLHIRHRNGTEFWTFSTRDKTVYIKLDQVLKALDYSDEPPYTIETVTWRELMNKTNVKTRDFDIRPKDLKHSTLFVTVSGLQSLIDNCEKKELVEKVKFLLLEKLIPVAERIHDRYEFYDYVRHSNSETGYKFDKSNLPWRTWTMEDLARELCPFPSIGNSNM